MKGIATFEVEGEQAACEAAVKMIERSAWFAVEPRPFDIYSFSVKTGEGHKSIFDQRKG